MVNNLERGGGVSIHEIAGVLEVAYGQAFTLSNIVKGFWCTWIYLYTPTVFGDFHFSGSNVTKHPYENDTSPVSDLATEPTPGTSRSANPRMKLVVKLCPFPKMQSKKMTKQRGNHKGLFQLSTALELI